MKIKEYKNGAWVTMEDSNDWRIVKVYSPNGDLKDKVRCDSKRAGAEYFKAFCAIAKAMRI